MNRKSHILFDLDGTLTNPKEGITKGVQYALKHFGIIENQIDRLTVFIGPPLAAGFSEFYGFPPEKSQEAILYYREYYKEIGIFQNFPYPGINQLLKSLQSAGKQLVVATSKPEVFALRILDHFALSPYFTTIAGAELDSRNDKGEVIAYALGKAKILTKENTVMVGDRKYDLIGARENNLDSIGVLYGFGDRAELSAQNPTALSPTVSALSQLLLGESSLI